MEREFLLMNKLMLKLFMVGLKRSVSESQLMGTGPVPMIQEKNRWVMG